jgi:peptide/nickel transport system substrate-binding protein
MLYSIDRQKLVDTVQLGFSQVAVFPGFPDDPVYRLAEQQSYPRYAYDPTRAQQLFADAGWTKGQDGLLRNSAGVTVPFPCCRYASNRDSNDIQESLAVDSELQAAGIDARHPIPESATGLSGAEARRAQTVGWAGQIGNFRVTSDQYWAALLATSIARQETSWAGINSGAWTDPTYESLYARWAVTLNPAQRRDVELDLLKIVMDELPFLPLYYNPLGVAVRKGVEGVGKGVPLNRGLTSDIHTWDIK